MKGSMDRFTIRQADGWTDRQRPTLTDGEIDKQTNRQIDRLTNRKTHDHHNFILERGSTAGWKCFLVT